MQRYLSILVFLVILSVAGCATTDDLRRLRGDLNQQIQLTNDKIAGVELGSANVKGEMTDLRRDIEKTSEKTSEAFKSLRSGQADGRVDMTEIRDQIQQIRGTIDGLRRDLSAISARVGKREEEDKAFREKLDSLTFKINFIENFLGIGKKEEQADAAGEKNGKLPAAPPKDTAGKVKTDKESLYTAAYELFREAKYEKSREGFENFLRQYPDTEFSDNAQFWIGECYYFEKKYEKAIIEYEKVTKNFPDGNKVPYALLKQGLSFLKLGDKASAKLLLQQVIKDFPNTSQARIARAKLLEIK
ncbi:MAG: tol-pal system protein YbgF [Syntrophus sp. (in: bacteria)]|nr:tol-pal system protein YbgF [Syntrophus sp. (in: bacteria)]